MRPFLVTFFKSWLSGIFWFFVAFAALSVLFMVYLLFGWLGVIVALGIVFFGVGGTLEAILTGAVMGVAFNLVSKKMGRDS